MRALTLHSFHTWIVCTESLKSSKKLKKECLTWSVCVGVCGFFLAPLLFLAGVISAPAVFFPGCSFRSVWVRGHRACLRTVLFKSLHYNCLDHRTSRPLRGFYGNVCIYVCVCFPPPGKWHRGSVRSSSLPCLDPPMGQLTCSYQPHWRWSQISASWLSTLSSWGFLIFFSLFYPLFFYF